MENIIKKITRITDITRIDKDGVVIEVQHSIQEEYCCTICKEYFGHTETGSRDTNYASIWTDGKRCANHHVLTHHFASDDFIPVMRGNARSIPAEVECNYCHIRFHDIDEIIAHKYLHEKFDIVIDPKSNGSLQCKQCGKEFTSIRLYSYASVNMTNLCDIGHKHLFEHERENRIKSRIHIFKLLCANTPLDTDSASVIARMAYPIGECKLPGDK